MTTGVLVQPNFYEMDVGVWGFDETSVLSVSDFDGSLLPLLESSPSCIYTPAVSPFDFTMVTGVALRYEATFRVNYETMTVSGEMRFDGVENLKPASGVFCAVSVLAPNGSGSFVSEAVYPELPVGFSSACAAIELGRFSGAVAPSVSIKRIFVELPVNSEVPVIGNVQAVFIHGQLQHDTVAIEKSGTTSVLKNNLDFDVVVEAWLL